MAVFHSPGVRAMARWLALASIVAALGLCRLTGVAAEGAGSGDLDVDPFQQLVRDLILAELKEKYQDQREWGQTKKIQKTEIRGKWFEPRLETKTVDVNDGLWRRVEVTLVEPDKNLLVELRSLPAPAEGATAFSLTMQARIAGEARVERWRLGIKSLNATVRFDATVRARVDTRLGVRFERGNLLDDVVLDPKVTRVELELVDFDLRKLGVIGRDVARELSDPLKPLIDRELKRREGRVADKINAAIDKRRDHLRFSPEKYLASGWSKFAGALAGSGSEEKPAK